jgi:serine/threonine protein phosphatase PrpC
LYNLQVLSIDHKPNIESEQKRIKNSGLKVVAEKVDASLTIHKIQLSDGNKLATSRAFGDFEYKANEKYEIHEQAVIAIPEVVVQPRCNEDVVMIAACDGIWDVMTNEDVAMFVTQRLDHYFDSKSITEPFDASVLPKIGDELVLECLRRNSEDNMSVVIVALSNMADRVTGVGGSNTGSSGPLPINVPPKQLKYEPSTV